MLFLVEHFLIRLNSRLRALGRVLSLASLFVTSCAYQVGDSRSPQEHLRVFVPVIENGTSRALDLNIITGLLRETIEETRGVSLVNSAEKSDIVLAGKIIQYDRTWGPAAFKGTTETQSLGGIKKDYLSAESAVVTFGIELTKLSAKKELIWRGKFVERDSYQLSDRLQLNQGSAITPQIHTSREELLLSKLSSRIFRRAKAQIVDEF